MTAKDTQLVDEQPNFLQAGCPSCHPTNSVKALKGIYCCTKYHTVHSLKHTYMCTSDRKTKAMKERLVCRISYLLLLLWCFVMEMMTEC